MLGRDRDARLRRAAEIQRRIGLAAARNAAAAKGKTFSFGIRLHVIVRETESAAWDCSAATAMPVSDEPPKYSGG
jgi:alkanesulfonate monooxygenase SsuD/methylene tetrahydromethanopterin reductase-like flavin-dependent oxidoreductase (luciferase family)